MIRTADIVLGIVTSTCYRHPDRATGRSCTRCGRSACPECLVTASIGSHCRECVKAAQPSAVTRVRFWNAKQPNVATLALIAVNVIVFVIGVATGGSAVGSGSNGSLERNWSLYREAVAGGEWWRIGTSGFLHYGAMHLAFNMFALWQLGGMLERSLGRARFAMLYVASLFAGAAGVLALQKFGIQQGAHGGASGAIFGLFGALAAGLRARGASLMKSGIGPTLLINVVLTLSLGLSIGGHLGGFLGGAIIGYVMMAPPGRFTAQIRTAMPVIVGLASVAIALIAAR